MYKNTGDLSLEELKQNAELLTTWIVRYFENLENYPVLSKVQPGDIKKQIPDNYPEIPENFENILEDLDKIIVPGLTHWNHPAFFAYFNSTSCIPGILAEYLTAALNINGMIWKTSPALTELEEKMIEWLRKLINLSENFSGIIYDTASVSTLHAIAAARQNKSALNVRQNGLSGCPVLRVYISEHTHSSVEKAAIMLGIGLNNVIKIKTDEYFSMIPDLLEKQIENDLAAGYIPLCTVGTIGTTSVTSVDPIPEIVKICKKHNIWLHIDAAYGGSSAILPEQQYLFEGCDEADSFVFNPHKWLFHPIDISLLYLKDKNILRNGFSLVPEYLKTKEENFVENYMDYGVQLGRRFRSLKPWFILRSFGAEGLRVRVREHLRLAKYLEEKLSAVPAVKLIAPVKFATVCFAVEKGGVSIDENNRINMTLMESINESGKSFISHTKIGSRIVLRVSISGLRTEEKNIDFLYNQIVDFIKKEV